MDDETVTDPVVGEFWTEPEQVVRGSWCDRQHDVHDGRRPFACTRPAGHGGPHVAGGDGRGADPRRLRVCAVWREPS